MKYIEKRLETGTSLVDDVNAPAPASAPASTAAKNSFASKVNTTQPFTAKPSDGDADVESKDRNEE